MNERLSAVDILHCLGVDPDNAPLVFETLGLLECEMLEKNKKLCVFGQMAQKICKDKGISLKVYYAQLKRQMMPAIKVGAAVRCDTFGLPEHTESSSGILYALAWYEMDEFTVS